MHNRAQCFNSTECASTDPRTRPLFIFPIIIKVLGRFAERHGQPIVRIYNVRDASLRSSIRPNSKGPLISVAMSPSAAHVAIISGDCFHTLTVWQRRHLDWTGGAFIVARQLVGNQFTPNKLLCVRACAECHLVLKV